MRLRGYRYSFTVHREKVEIGTRTFKLPGQPLYLSPMFSEKGFSNNATPTGLFVKYSFDALRMTKRDHPSSTFAHLVTRVCALLGGAYVFFGLIYRGVSNTVELIAKKND